MAEIHRVTGVMSGSSLDGVDLAYCEFRKEGEVWDFNIVVAETIPYPRSIRKALDLACRMEEEAIRDLDRELGCHYADLVTSFHAKHRLVPDLISSHGHTIFHEPDRGITFQAGDGGIMAERTGIQVVSDFRRADVDQGGQGAPLVPAGDRLLFGDYDACLNLGGFANISYETRHRERVAFDICPVNMVLDWLAGLLGKAYDQDGEIARSGTIVGSLLETLNGIGYYGKLPPKSLGKEWFLDVFQPLIGSSRFEVSDLMATVVEHIAVQIASVVNNRGIDTLLTTGGGALNQFLLERLIYHTRATVIVPDRVLIQFKEAMVFAFLGLLRKLEVINCYASATGGEKDISTGIIHNPK